MSRDNFTLERAGRALALCGAAADATRLSAELTDRFPGATLTKRIQLPLLAAASAIHAGDAARVLALLNAVRRFDRARGSEFWPEYLRGQAYLAANNGKDSAIQFESILNHRGDAPDSMLYPLAQLGLGRAAALTGAREKARAAYDAFLAVWDGADGDLKLLQDAWRERALLQ